VRDYFAWRQADTHINNLYNTTFWSLVQQGGQTTTKAHATLRGTFSKDKNEILYSQFGISYGNLDARFRKGSVLVREQVHEEEDEAKPIPSSNIGDQPGTDSPSLPITDELIHKDDNTPSQTVEKTQSNNPTKSKEKKNKNKSKSVRSRIELMHCDIIKDEFWDARPGLLYM